MRGQARGPANEKTDDPVMAGLLAARTVDECVGVLIDGLRATERGIPIPDEVSVADIRRRLVRNFHTLPASLRNEANKRLVEVLGSESARFEVHAAFVSDYELDTDRLAHAVRAAGAESARFEVHAAFVSDYELHTGRLAHAVRAAGAENGRDPVELPNCLVPIPSARRRVVAVAPTVLVLGEDYASPKKAINGDMVAVRPIAADTLDPPASDEIAIATREIVRRRFRTPSEAFWPLHDIFAAHCDAATEALTQGTLPPKHPVAPLIEGLFVMMSDEVARNTRLDPLFPTSIVRGRRSRSSGESQLVREIRANKSPQAHFANMGPGEADHDIVQAAPVELWDLAMGAQHNKSAGLAARIFVDVLLDVRLRDFETAATTGVLLPGEAIHEFLVRLYPFGHRSWRPSRQFRGLREAISVLEDPETRIAWVDPKTNRRGERRVVVPVDFPLKWDSNACVRFAVFLPPGSTDAFILDRIATRTAGAHSVTAWRLYLNLSAHWGQPGKLRMPVRGGERGCKCTTRSGIQSSMTSSWWQWPSPAPNGGCGPLSKWRSSVTKRCAR